MGLKQQLPAQVLPKESDIHETQGTTADNESQQMKRQRKEPTPPPQTSKEEIKEVEGEDPQLMSPQEDTQEDAQSDSDVEIKVHISHKKDRKRNRMDIVERRKTLLQSVADVNAKVEIRTKTKQMSTKPCTSSSKSKKSSRHGWNGY